MTGHGLEDFATIIMGVVVGSVVATIAYFLRRIDAKIEANNQDIIAIRLQTAGLAAEIGNNAITAFNNMCKERQTACSMLHGSRFLSLEDSDKMNCNKILHLEKDRREAWREQRRWNEKIEEFVYNININGKIRGKERTSYEEPDKN